MKKIFPILAAAIIGGFSGNFIQNKFLPKEIAPLTISNSAEFKPANFNYLSTNESLSDFSIAAEKTIHSVVHVKNLKEGNLVNNKAFEYFFGYQYKSAPQMGSGSGVIISSDGYIVTNHHVIDKASKLSVTLNNNSTYEASVIGSDPLTDIALVKIETEEPLPYLSFGDSDMAKIGEWVLAVGNPFNLTSTVTAGIISAKAREFDKNQSFIQTDAAVNPGNSGGALVNTNGDLIGINTAISSQTGSYIGYSFAVPSNTARKVVQDIMEFGTVKKAVLGIYAITSPELLSSNYGVEDLEGVYISGVEEGSSAKEAGLKEGDIIKQIDYLEIKKFSDLTGYLASKRPQDAVVIKVSRNGKLSDFKVVLKEKQTALLPIIGFTVKNLSPEDQKRFKIKNGVKIIGVPVAYENYGLIGKVVVSIDDKPIINIDKATELFQNINKFNRTSISMINENGERERLIFQ
ncbi:trypsin-like peptidase domain-containing protein [Flavobacteriaceae bacterium]|nr:trypsin-like peptidase domain-containing protein [Flavobacteriaceae bacterium]